MFDGSTVTDTPKAPALAPRHPTLAQTTLRRQAQDAFLAAYEKLGGPAHAADAVGISRQSHYDWLDTDEDYKRRWELAQAAANESLVVEATRRARDGYEQGVYYEGVRVATERKYSDGLLMFLIKGRMPEYRDRYEVGGIGGGPVQVEAVRADALSRLSPAQIDALLALNPGAQAPAALPDVAVEAEPEPGEGEQ